MYQPLFEDCLKVDYKASKHKQEFFLFFFLQEVQKLACGRQRLVLLTKQVLGQPHPDLGVS